MRTVKLVAVKSTVAGQGDTQNRTRRTQTTPAFVRVVRVSGVGLTLSIATDLVEAPAGAIMVESRLGQGSVFTVTLPQAKSNHPHLA